MAGLGIQNMEQKNKVLFNFDIIAGLAIKVGFDIGHEP
jgi:hypothetical protein